LERNGGSAATTDSCVVGKDNFFVNVGLTVSVSQRSSHICLIGNLLPQALSKFFVFLILFEFNAKRTNVEITNLSFLRNTKSSTSNKITNGILNVLLQAYK
jgi:hypothetical protein